jgi:hypothetical protein
VSSARKEITIGKLLFSVVYILIFPTILLFFIWKLALDRRSSIFFLVHSALCDSNYFSVLQISCTSCRKIQEAGQQRAEKVGRGCCDTAYDWIFWLDYFDAFGR